MHWILGLSAYAINLPNRFMRKVRDGIASRFEPYSEVVVKYI
jgi:hypothetical protein